MKDKITQKQIKKLLNGGGRKGAGADFDELLKRAIKFSKLIKLKN